MYAADAMGAYEQFQAAGSGCGLHLSGVALSSGAV